MRPGQVRLVYRSAALSLARHNMRRRQAKDPSAASDQRICTKENCLTCCKKFTAFMFSRVGLFLVMIGYVAFGGLLFQALEAGNERNMRLIMDLELNTTLYKLWEEILRVNSFPYKDKKGNFSLYASNELEQFEATVIRQVQQGFDGRTTDADNDWNYFGAVLYAVTLVSTIGYGHITTKTTQGKIATILYSAFGVPLMMLFVANIGSTMAKMFAFVFSRITMVFCCRMSHKKKRALTLKNRQKLVDKGQPTTVVIDEKVPLPTVTTKSNLKPVRTEHEPAAVEKRPLASTSVTNVNETSALRQLPADVRLNMLTGMSSTDASRSLASSTTSVTERSKDAIVRINELIRQNSVQDFDESMSAERHRRRSAEFSPIAFYISETNKLTSNLDGSTADRQDLMKRKQDDENNMKQVILPEDGTSNVAEQSKKKGGKASKKILKRSKSESASSPPQTRQDAEPVATAKPARRRFFSRNSSKLKKQAQVEEEQTTNAQQRQMSAAEVTEKNSTIPSLPPPPDYEQSTPSPATVTWKTEDQFYPTKSKFNLDGGGGGEFDDDDDEDDEDEEASVPLLVTVFVIPLYLTLGAILFNIWEQWGFLNSFYFCFITLTTIGFGDFVPGSALNVQAEKEKLISAALYILLGLVLIAMCVNLMKEQLSQKVKRVASKLGRF